MSYPGSKEGAGVYHRIIGQVPPISTYVEGYYGEGSIYRHMAPARTSYLIDTNPKCLRGLKQTEAVRPLLGKFLELLPNIPLHNDALIYADPPYPLDTRQQRLYYEHEMTDDDHSALVRALLQAPCYVMVSTYPNAIYSAALGHWRCIEYQVMTRGGLRTELLYCNFDEPEALHDPRYAGRDFRERCAIMRMERNIVNKLKRLPARWRDRITRKINGYPWPPAKKLALRSAPQLPAHVAALTAVSDISANKVARGAVAPAGRARMIAAR